MKGKRGKGGLRGRHGPRCPAGPRCAAHAREKEGGAREQAGAGRPPSGLVRQAVREKRREGRKGAAGPPVGQCGKGEKKGLGQNLGLGQNGIKVKKIQK